jgi:hypothetical protein
MCQTGSGSSAAQPAANRTTLAKARHATTPRSSTARRVVLDPSDYPDRLSRGSRVLPEHKASPALQLHGTTMAAWHPAKERASRLRVTCSSGRGAIPRSVDSRVEVVDHYSLNLTRDEKAQPRACATCVWLDVGTSSEVAVADQLAQPRIKCTLTRRDSGAAKPSTGEYPAKRLYDAVGHQTPPCGPVRSVGSCFSGGSR